MNEHPHKVTVLMPVYNAALYLKESIDSILEQTYQHFEFIIINDGSTDGSLKLIESYSDPRIKIINNPVNLGIIASRNKGLGAATGKYIANMDADDISLPARLEKQVKFLDANPDVAIVAAKLILIDPSGSEIGVWPEDSDCVTEIEIRNTLPRINCIGQPTTMMRSSLIKEIGYNAAFLHNEDWGLWLHVLSLGKRITKLPEVLLKYRQHSKSTTVTANHSGVAKKILSFKFRYLKFKIFRSKFKSTDKKVLASFAKELIRFAIRRLAPRAYDFAWRLKKLDKKRYRNQFFRIKSELKKLNSATNHIYFFPFFHTGGAERVHTSILEAARQKDAIVFITSRSDNAAFYEQMSQQVTVIEIDELLLLGFSERWLIKKISTLLPDSSEGTAFGCNSLFFYQLIPHLSAKITIIDLLHAFLHNYEEGPEQWSLPHITRLTNRVVINEKTKKDFAALYKKNNIPKDYLSRITVITNYVETFEENAIKDKSIFNVAYLGRGGEEKRVHLIAQLAKLVSSSHNTIQFHFVGKLKDVIPEELHKFCIFHGEINDETEIQKLYSKFHSVIIASTREGFPMVIMEGMMRGAVPLSTNVGGIPEHVIDNETGFLIQAKEDEILQKFAEKIKYLNENRIEFLRLSENAHTYAVKNFSKTEFFKAWHSLLNPN